MMVFDEVEFIVDMIIYDYYGRLWYGLWYDYGICLRFSY